MAANATTIDVTVLTTTLDGIRHIIRPPGNAKVKESDVFRAARQFVEAAQPFVEAFGFTPKPDDPMFMATAALLEAQEVFDETRQLLSSGTATQPPGWRRLGRKLHLIPRDGPVTKIKFNTSVIKALLQILEYDGKTKVLGLLKNPGHGGPSRAEEQRDSYAKLVVSFSDVALEITSVAAKCVQGAMESVQIGGPGKTAGAILGEVVGRLIKYRDNDENRKRLLKLIKAWDSALNKLGHVTPGQPAPDDIIIGAISAFYHDIIHIAVSLQVSEEMKIVQFFAVETFGGALSDMEKDIMTTIDMLTVTLAVKTHNSTSRNETALSAQQTAISNIHDTTIDTASVVNRTFQALLEGDKERAKQDRRSAKSLRTLQRLAVRHEEGATDRYRIMLAVLVVLFAVLWSQGGALASLVRNTSKIATTVEAGDRLIRDDLKTGFQSIEAHLILRGDPQSGVQIDVSLSGELPPPPDIFEGRDSDLQALIPRVFATPGESIAILGPGGIGKTTLARAIIHHDDVRQRFASRTYAFSCDSFIDANGLVAHLAHLLGINETTNPLPAVTDSLRNAGLPSLVIADGLERVWNATSNTIAKGTEQVLQSIAGIPNVTLVVAILGNEAPLKPFPPRSRHLLGPLSSHAARALFAKRSGWELETPSATELLDDIDGVPLAIELLAQIVLLGTTPSKLLASWKRSQFLVLSTELTGPAERSVAWTIETSLSFLPSYESNAGPRHILALLSMLPDGLRPKVVEDIRRNGNFEIADVDGALRTLLRLALVRLDRDNVYRVLSPVRFYVAQKYPPAPAQRTALLNIFYSIAQLTSGHLIRNVRPEERAETVAEFVQEYRNVGMLLLDVVLHDFDSSPKFFYALVAWVRFGEITPASCTLPKAYVDHLTKFPGDVDPSRGNAHLGESMLHLSACFGRRQEYGLELDYLRRAKETAKRLTDSLPALIDREIGRVLRHDREQDANAELHLEAACTRFRSAGEVDHLAVAIMDLAGAQERTRGVKTALTTLQEAFDIISPQHNQVNYAQLLMLRGEMLVRDGQYLQGEADLAAAQAGFRDLGSTRIVIDCLYLRHNNLANLDPARARVILPELVDGISQPAVGDLAKHDQDVAILSAPLLAIGLFWDGRRSQAVQLLEGAVRVTKEQGLGDAHSRAVRLLNEMKQVMRAGR